VNLLIQGHSFRYEMERLAMMFFPMEKINWYVDDAPEGEPYILTRMEQENNKIRLTAGLVDAIHRPDSIVLEQSDKKEVELALGRLLYQALARDTGITPPWGILTGIRPVKLFRDQISQYGKVELAEKAFSNDFLVTPAKIELAKHTEGYEQAIMEQNSPMDFSLYVSIPFCPTRCHYCSFVSHGIQQARKLMPQYLETLHQELIDTACIAKELGLRLTTVYFGGGTPTTLSHQELDLLMGWIEKYFDLSALQEYTVEAGRPDTITREKLRVIHAHGAGRISVNPQTFHDHVLQNIGRGHTVAQFMEVTALQGKWTLTASILI